ncbi:TOM1-like protein 9 isoform X3 [Primulina tabacum]
MLILIDTWHEAFGGTKARYPQYFTAYQDLLRLGAVFPQRSDRSAPVVTPAQTVPVTSYPQVLRNSESRPDATESSAEATLSFADIQNARGIMDVLAEMLSALDPSNKEGIKQEVLVDLVEQCRTYKQRVVHLVNSTLDESLLCQGLALNDAFPALAYLLYFFLFWVIIARTLSLTLWCSDFGCTYLTDSQLFFHENRRIT